MPDQWLEVSDLTEISQDQWCGAVQLSGKRFPTKILIYKFKGELRGIERFCPHQGYDLVGSEVSEVGSIKCQWHGLTFSILEPKTSFQIEEKNEKFYCLDSK